MVSVFSSSLAAAQVKDKRFLLRELAQNEEEAPGSAEQVTQRLLGCLAVRAVGHQGKTAQRERLLSCSPCPGVAPCSAADAGPKTPTG